MKKPIMHFLYFGILVLLACKNSDSEKNTKEVNTEKAATETDKSPGSASQGGEGPAGEWILVRQAEDSNRNRVLDEDERKNGFLNTKYSYRFNDDGSCLISNMKLKGRYEIKTENDKKKLNVYTSVDGPEQLVEEWIISSVNKDELVLWDVYDVQGFWIFNRD